MIPATPPIESLGKPAPTAELAAKARAARTPEDARRTAIEFEAVFLSQMLAPMFNEIDTDGPFGGGSGETVYRSLMVDEYGKLIARAGGIGLADSVMREILKHQETP